MKARKHLLQFAVGLAMVLTCNVLSGHAAANLAPTMVSGPTEVFLNHTISVTYKVKNNGDAASEGYDVKLYLSKNKTYNAGADTLLKKVSFAEGLAAGEVRETTTNVVVRDDYFKELAGDYYYLAIVEPNKKASADKVAVARFQDNGDGTVTDFKTGMMWQQADDITKRAWADAETYCRELALGGYGNWVLPPLAALQTIVDYSRANPAIDPVFTVCHSHNYWSNTAHANEPNEHAWDVNFTYGAVATALKTDTYFVRCVRP